MPPKVSTVSTGGTVQYREISAGCTKCYAAMLWIYVDLSPGDLRQLKAMVKYDIGNEEMEAWGRCRHWVIPRSQFDQYAALIESTPADQTAFFRNVGPSHFEFH